MCRKLEQMLHERLDALGPAPRAELLRVLTLPDFERADRIGEFWSYPESRAFAELLIDCEEDRVLRGGAGRDVARSRALAERAGRSNRFSQRTFWPKHDDVANQKDPGWLPSLRGLWWFLIPIVNMKKMSGRRTKESALIVLRTVVLGIVASLFLFLWAMSFITPWDGGDERWVPWAVVVIGVVSLAYIARIRRRPSRQLRQRPLPVITEHWSSSGSVSPRTLPCWDSLAYSWGAVFGSISSAWPSVSLGYG